MKSKKYTLNLRDLAKGILIAAGTAAAFTAQQTIDSGSLAINGKQIAMAAIAGGLAYLVKKFTDGEKEKTS